MKKPTIRPTVEPVVAILLAPAFLVIMIGKRLSKTETSMAKMAVTISTQSLISFKSEKYAARRPNQAKGGPGRTGRKVPIKPTTRITAAIIVNNKSVPITII